MTRKLYVEGLGWDVDDVAFHAAFAAFGEVTAARVVLDPITGRTRGFGFVTFADAAAADAAREAMDGAPLHGRALRVEEARNEARER